MGGDVRELPGIDYRGRLPARCLTVAYSITGYTVRTDYTMCCTEWSVDRRSGRSGLMRTEEFLYDRNWQTAKQAFRSDGYGRK